MQATGYKSYQKTNKNR